MKYQEIYNNVNYDFPQCGGYRVLQSPNKKVLVIETESNYSGNFTCRRERIEYTQPIDFSGLTAQEIEQIKQDPRVKIIKKGHIVQ
jgi:hypothetical protein